MDPQMPIAVCCNLEEELNRHSPGSYEYNSNVTGLRLIAFRAIRQCKTEVEIKGYLEHLGLTDMYNKVAEHIQGKTKNTKKR